MNALLHSCRLFVIIQNTAVRQRQIGDEMKAVKRFPDRQVGYRRIHMRMQLQSRMPTPCAFHMQVDETVGDNWAIAMEPSMSGISFRLTWVPEIFSAIARGSQI